MAQLSIFYRSALLPTKDPTYKNLSNFINGSSSYLISANINMLQFNQIYVVMSAAQYLETKYEKKIYFEIVT